MEIIIDLDPSDFKILVVLNERQIAAMDEAENMGIDMDDTMRSIIRFVGRGKLPSWAKNP